MIKLTDKYYIKKDLHGWLLLEKTIAHKKDTKEPYEKFNSTFHANLQQIAQKVLHENSDVQGDLDDLKSAWFHCVNEIKNVLEGRCE